MPKMIAPSKAKCSRGSCESRAITETREREGSVVPGATSASRFEPPVCDIGKDCTSTGVAGIDIRLSQTLAAGCFAWQSISSAIVYRSHDARKCNGQMQETRCRTDNADLRRPNTNLSRSCIGTLVTIAARREAAHAVGANGLRLCCFAISDLN